MAWFALGLALASLAWSALAVAISRRELRALVRGEAALLARPLTVVIPARNEERRIGPVLDALLADPSRELSVVVYDDRSTDGTRALIEARARVDKRVRVIVGTEEPNDGKGKPLALHAACATLAPDVDLVLFLDADVTLAQGALGALVHALGETKAHALSGAPRLVSGTFVEELTVPAFASTVGARFLPSRVHDDARPDAAFLNGQLILVERAALDEVGGFYAVKNAVLEDVALARRLKSAGKRLRLVDLRALASTRMYTSWREIAQGFGKNAVALQGTPLRTAMLAVVGLVVACLPWSAAVVAALATTTTTTTMTTIACAAAALALQAFLRVSAGSRAWTALLLPIAYTLVAVVLVRAAYGAATGGTVEWKGRRYRAGAE